MEEQSRHPLNKVGRINLNQVDVNMETHWPNTYSYSCVIMNDPENQKLQSNTTRSSSSFPISLETGNLQGIIFSMWNSVQSIHSPSTQGLESRIWKGRSDCLFSRIESHRFRAHTFIIMPSDRSVLGRKNWTKPKAPQLTWREYPNQSQDPWSPYQCPLCMQECHCWCPS